MPITSNLTNIPPKSLLLPFGADMGTKSVNSKITFDASGNVTLSFSILDGLFTYDDKGGDPMPLETIAISKIPNANVLPNNATMTFTVPGDGTLGVTVYFEVTSSDVGKQKNPNLQFHQRKH